MKNSKHTPGPWECGLDHVWQVGSETEIARVFTGKGWDVRLIAAAPELLDAVLDALDLIKNELGEGVVSKKLRDALAKAEGRQKLVN